MTPEITLKPTPLSPVSQGNGQLNEQLKSPNLDGHPNGYDSSIQKPQKKVGDEWREVPVVAINGDTDIDDRVSKSVTHPRPPSPLNGANGSEPGFIKGSQQPPIPNMQDVDVDSISSATASPATASISAALAPSPSPPTTLPSPITPTPSSMSFTSHQNQSPAQLDLTSHQANLEIPSSMQSPESSSNSNTPRIPSAVLLSSSYEGYKGDEGIDKNQKEDRGSHRETTKIVIPDSSTLGIDHSTPSSTSISNPYPNSSTTPTTSRPSSTSIDPNLFSNRPAPPSPALSRRVSGVPSVASTSSTHSRSRSRSSRPPSSVMSRTNSTRMSGVGSDAKRQSLGTQLSQFLAASTDTGDRDGGSTTPTTTLTGSGSPLGSPQKLSFRLSPQTQATSPTSASLSSTNAPSASTAVASPTIVPTPSDPVSTPTPTPTTATIFPAQPLPNSAPTLATPLVYIKIRDFGFASTDERHLGLGTDTPKANRVHRLNRKLGRPDRARAAAAAALDPSAAAGAGRPELGSRRTDSIGSMGSVDSSDADVEEEEEEEEDEGWGIGISGWGGGGKGGGKGWDGFRMGMGRFSWTVRSNNSNSRNDAGDNDNHSKGTSSNGSFPSRKDLDMNFMDGSSSSSSDDERKGRGYVVDGVTEEFPEDFDDDLDETGLQNCHPGDEDEYADAEDGEQEPLYPGLYRALYAFEPEGTAEMKLDEGQIVRVVGRGGGIGWAVVDDDRGGSGVPLKHALVPEGYLEAVRLDWEDEEEALESAGDRDVDIDAAKAGVP